MSSKPEASKRSAGRSVKPRSGEGLGRHLEGWQPAVLAIFIAGTMALLVVPRPVEPDEIPVPASDPRAAALEMATDDARAAASERDGLDVDVRALGSAIHAYGRADYDADEERLLATRAKVVEASVAAVALGDEGVLRLRAFQQRAFVREVRRWEATGVVSDSLLELGGGFLRFVERNRWADTRGSGRRLLMDELALRASFKKRWNEITGIRGAAFEPSLEEHRALTRFLLEHPTAMVGAAGGGTEPAAWRAARLTHEDQFRLRKIDELAAIDSGYPRELARGVVLYRLGRYPLAVEAFRKHLEVSPDGPYSLRAQNYLRAALGRARDEQF